MLRHAALLLGFHIGLSVVAWSAATGFGRVPLPCEGGPVVVQPRALCAMNRHYAVPEVRDLLVAMAEGSGQPVRVLDAGFPLFDGFPLSPHLSHRDGHSVDVALAYEGAEGRPSAAERDPRPAARCGAPVREACLWLAAEDPAHGLRRVLVEPHLPERLGVESPLFRCQACGVARHDDHLHLEVRRTHVAARIMLD